MDERLKKAKQYRYWICLVVFVSYLLVFFHRLCPAVIALDIQETFSLSGTVLGVLGSAYFYPYALMQIPTGLMADSLGSRKTIAFLFFLAAIGSVIMGLAPSLGWAVAGRVLVGTGVATIFVCNFKLLSQWFCARRFVTMGGLFMATGGLGALTAGAPLAWLSDSLGWRMSLVVVGGFTFVMAVLVFLVVRDSPEDMGWPRPGGEMVRQKHNQTSLWGGLKEVVCAARFWPISLWGLFAIGLSFAMGSLWGGPFLMQVYGLSKAAAGGVLATFALALLVGSPIMGMVANRVGRKPVFISCSLLLSVIFLALFLFPGSLPMPLLYVIFFCLSLAGAATGPVIAAVSKELFRLEIAGTSVGMVNLFPFLGGALFQIAMGAILSWHKQTGADDVAGDYKMMFLFALAGALVSLLLSFFLTETKPGAKKAA